MYENNIYDYGYCGECRWSFSNDGVLTIEPPEGRTEGMLDVGEYNGESYDWPWSYYCADIRQINIREGVQAGESIAGIFAYMSECEVFDLSALDTSRTKDMSEAFIECEKLSDINFMKSWDFDSTECLEDFLSCCPGISDLEPLRGKNVENVTNISGILAVCDSVTDISVFESLNFTNLRDTSYAFNGSGITDISPLAGLDMSHVKDASYMFCDCPISDAGPAAGWNVGNLVCADGMFRRTDIKDSSPFSGWKMPGLKSCREMFDMCDFKDISPFRNMDLKLFETYDSFFPPWAEYDGSHVFANDGQAVNFVLKFDKGCSIRLTLDNDSKVSATDLMKELFGSQVTGDSFSAKTPEGASFRLSELLAASRYMEATFREFDCKSREGRIVDLSGLLEIKKEKEPLFNSIREGNPFYDAYISKQDARDNKIAIPDYGFDDDSQNNFIDNKYVVNGKRGAEEEGVDLFFP